MVMKIEEKTGNGKREWTDLHDID